MTNELSTAPLRLFQVNLMAWGQPVMIAACDFKDAASLAGVSRCAMRGLGGLMVIDATDQFAALSIKVASDTQRMLACGMRGSVEYDQENGWSLLEA